MQKYRQAFLLGIQNAMEYRANFLLSMVSALVPIFIQFFLWTTIYHGDQSLVINGYSYFQIITYTIMASIITRLNRTGFEYDINDDIKNGGLNKYLVKPVDYFSYRLSCFIGQKLIHTLLMLIMIVGVFILLATRFDAPLTVTRIAFFFISLILAFILNFMLFFSVAMSGFWLFEIGFLFEAIRIIIIMLSGGIFPLDIFGEKAAVILNYLPFKYTINFPVELLNGRVNPGTEYQGLIIQIVWILIFTLIAKMLWAAGNKRYVAVGG
ncbi:MAG TPA: ABC-2 family transporter protein [Bacillota bacterium]|nr:ABC-2 family transporter protein [Bacillota bacterium]